MKFFAQGALFFGFATGPSKPFGGPERRGTV